MAGRAGAGRGEEGGCRGRGVVGERLFAVVLCVEEMCGQTGEVGFAGAGRGWAGEGARAGERQ